MRRQSLQLICLLAHCAVCESEALPYPTAYLENQKSVRQGYVQQARRAHLSFATKMQMKMVSPVHSLLLRLAVWPWQANVLYGDWGLGTSKGRLRRAHTKTQNVTPALCRAMLGVGWWRIVLPNVTPLQLPTLPPRPLQYKQTIKQPQKATLSRPACWPLLTTGSKPQTAAATWLCLALGRHPQHWPVHTPCCQHTPAAGPAHTPLQQRYGRPPQTGCLLGPAQPAAGCLRSPACNMYSTSRSSSSSSRQCVHRDGTQIMGATKE